MSQFSPAKPTLQVQLSRGNFSKDVFDSTRHRLEIDEQLRTGVLKGRKNIPSWN